MSEPTEKETRGTINLRIKFRSATLDEFITRYAVDVSRGGIFIRTREPLSVGSRLKLDFQLLDAAPLLEGEGTVVWIRQSDPARSDVMPGMGVRFDRLMPESQTRLDRILSEKERLGQAGQTPGVSRTGGGMAVRRSTGAFAAIDPTGIKASPPTATSSSAPPTAMATPAAPGAEAPGGPSPPPRPAAAPSAFGRPRTTSGVSPLRSAPVPSALFEAPTPDDIDKALSVLEERPGPVPPRPPPPPRLNADDPIPVADDPSNDPTRVGSDAPEFSLHEAVTGKVSAVLPETGVPELDAAAAEDLTVPASLRDDEPTLAASPAALANAERVPPGGESLAGKAPPLDAPLAAHLQTAIGSSPPASPGPGLRKKALVLEAANPAESSRFRTDATYRRPRTAAKRVAVLLVLAAAGGGAFVFRDRFRRVTPSPAIAIAPTAAAVPQPTPEPAADAATSGAVVDAAAAASAVAAAEGAAGAAGAEKHGAKTDDAPAAAARAEQGPTATAPEKPAATVAPEVPRPKRHRIHVASPDSQVTAEKPAGETQAAPKDGSESTAGSKPADGVAGTDSLAPGPSAAPPPAAPPLLKITSTPAGAEVIIDGNSLGNTPFSSKDIDPTASHTITVKKDGYEAFERTIAAGDWSHARGGPALKVTAKLHRTGPAQPGQDMKKDGKPDVEILTPD